jgi:uncharacterized protein YraI
MLGRKTLFAVAAVIAGLLLPAQAMAAYEAYTRADLNLRVGPSTSYGVIDVIPHGEPVLVLGCLAEYEWCDVEWYGLRGWVSARYLVQPGTTVYLPQIAPRIGLPIISFSFGAYHDRYYRDRPWYRQRSGRWRGRDWRRDRPRERPRTEQREERRETERPRQRQETQRPRQQLQQTEQPRRQRQETQRPRQQPQQAEQPRQGERTQRSRRQRQEAEQTQQDERAQRQGRSRAPGQDEELEEQRGQ